MTAADDTAIVNVPLAKRGAGTLDAQIDRHLSEQAAQKRHDAKRKAVERRADKAMAKAILAEHLAAMVAHYGPKLGAKAVRDMLTGWAKWEPARLIDFAAKFLNETDDRSHETRDESLPF